MEDEELIQNQGSEEMPNTEHAPAERETSSLRDLLDQFVNGYVSAKRETFAGHAMGTLVRRQIPDQIKDIIGVDASRYRIQGSVGQGNWAGIPWIAIMDRRITTTAQDGVYIVYLLSDDGGRLYLTLIQGYADLKNDKGKKEVGEILSQGAAKLRSQIDPRGLRADDQVSLGPDSSEKAFYYGKGIVFYQEYEQGALPPEERLVEDLNTMLEVYRDYVSIAEHGEDKEASAVPETVVREDPETMTVREAMDRIKSYIAAKGFTYPDGMIENFYLSLKSKPFVILAGISGTGKTRLVRLFAEAVGANTKNGRYQMVSVRPDWSDSSDLFGHVDLNGTFVPGPVLDFIKRASEDITHPYFLSLDEMNLARVEYYMSDILSVIETRDVRDGVIVTDPLVSAGYYGQDQEAAQKYGEIRFPENLYLIGTVNMDETTFPFSRKVLDRANTIEFSYVDLMPKREDPEPVEALELTNDFFKTEYLYFQQCDRDRDRDVVDSWCLTLQKINQILQKENAHVGYRVRDEIVFYLLHNYRDGLLEEDTAVDNEILQKILPRIQGSTNSVKNVLCELFQVCAGDYEGVQRDEISAKMFAFLNHSASRYQSSAKKIAYMVGRFEEDGFTSYWL